MDWRRREEVASNVRFRPIADIRARWQLAFVQKRDQSRKYLKNGYVNAAIVILMTTVVYPIGNFLEGRPIIPGLFTATYYAVVLTLCLILLLIGVRRVRSQSGDS